MVQVALALVLLTGAGLLLRSFVAFVSLDRGFEITGVVTADVRVDRPASVYRRGGRRIEPDAIDARNAELRQANEALLLQMERIENLPGVAAVALSSGRPLNSANSMRPVEVAGRPAPGDQREELWAGVRRVDPGYAEVMRLRLRDGRFLADSDGPGRPRAAVVSESFARAAFGGAPPVGRHFRFAVDEQTWEVIGVVADVTPLYDMAFQPVAGDIYVSMLQPESNPYPPSSLPVVMVRTAGDSDAIIPLLREMIAHVHPEAQVYATTLDTALSREAAQPRFSTRCARGSSRWWRYSSLRSVSMVSSAMTSPGAGARSASAWRSAPDGATSSSWSAVRQAYASSPALGSGCSRPAWLPASWKASCSVSPRRTPSR